MVLAPNAGPQVSRCGVTLKRRCAHLPSVIYLIVNKVLSLSLSLSRQWFGPSCVLLKLCKVLHLRRTSLAA